MAAFRRQGSSRSRVAPGVGFHLAQWALGLAVAPWVALLSGCGPASFLITPVPAQRELQEEVITREGLWATQKIALLDVDGMIQNDRPGSLMGLPGENPVALFKEQLDQSARDKRVKAIVLRINSSGGTVTASDLMHTELLRFKRKTGKPVIACFLDVAASGAYYLACAADRIYAHPTTITGSIGVIAILPQVTGTMQKLGIGVHVFKSGKLKDAGSPLREMNPTDEAMFEALIADMYARFLDVVRRGRPQLVGELEEIADGRVMLAEAAKAQGLVDEIGTLHDALRAAKVAAGLADDKVLVVRYMRPLHYRPNIYAQTDAPPAPPAQVNLINVQLPEWLSGGGPKLLYLWAPGW